VSSVPPTQGRTPTVGRPPAEHGPARRPKRARFPCAVDDDRRAPKAPVAHKPGAGFYPLAGRSARLLSSGSFRSSPRSRPHAGGGLRDLLADATASRQGTPRSSIDQWYALCHGQELPPKLPPDCRNEHGVGLIALLRGAPGRVRTCDPPLRRCRHRVRTRSSLSSQPPRPGLSPRHG
jgi:hypothetical protein